jgi:hypothetical protein
MKQLHSACAIIMLPRSVAPQTKCLDLFMRAAAGSLCRDSLRGLHIERKGMLGVPPAYQSCV